MEVKKSDAIGGSLQISTEVISKIAKLAALEVEGVAGVATGNSGVRGIFSKTNIQKAVTVTLQDEVANISVNLVVDYAAKIPVLCNTVQQNIKTAVQNMTGIAVSKVNILITGVAPQPATN